jgi:hypothetical protein
MDVRTVAKNRRALLVSTIVPIHSALARRGRRVEAKVVSL